MTVLFADVKGSMELAEQLDPEEWHQILDRFFAILTDGVHRFEGTVNQYTGDGIMALFGAPIAHEDHAQRACYAALQLRDEITRYATEVKRTAWRRLLDPHGSQFGRSDRRQDRRRPVGHDASLAGLATMIHARTGGNPFFTKEVVRSPFESGALQGTRGNYRLVTPMARLQVPPTVQALLASRIDRLGEREKHVLQTAAVIGKDFPEPHACSASCPM